jgi:DNA-binding transcriptional MerR regulator
LGRCRHSQILLEEDLLCIVAPIIGLYLRLKVCSDTHNTHNIEVKIMTERDVAQGEMEKKLQDWGAKLDEMKAKVDQSGADTKAQLEGKIETLTVRRDAMQQRLADLKGSSDEAWHSVKTGLQAAWNDVSEAFEEAAAKFK